MFTYAVTWDTMDLLLKEKQESIERLRLVDYNTDLALVPSQDWGDVGHFTPPIRSLYFERDDTLPLNHSISHRNGSTQRGIYYVVVDKDVAYKHGIHLKGLGL